MRISPVLAGVAAGAVLVVGGAAAIDFVTQGAQAQGGDPVTQDDLAAANQRSQAAINGYKNLSNRLGKYVNDPGQLIGARSGPIRQDRGVAGGLPTSVIADGAITSAKLAPGVLTSATTSATINGVPAGGALSGTYPDPGIAPGAVGPDQLAAVPAARLESGTSVTPGNFSAPTLSWGEVIGVPAYDPFDMHTAAQPERITVPRDGLYQVTANVSFAPNSAGERRMVLTHTNPGGVTRSDAVHLAATPFASGTTLNATQLYPMQAGDFVTVSVRQGSGGSLTVTPGTFSAVYLGPLA